MEHRKKYTWSPLALSLIKAIVIYAIYAAISLSLIYSLITILSSKTLTTDPFVQSELLPFFQLLITLILVLFFYRKKWLETPTLILPFKSMNMILIIIMALANRFFITGALSLDEFINDIPINKKRFTHDFGIPLNILIALTHIILGPIIEEIIFRKWILGLFLSLGKYIYLGLVVSSVLFIHPDSSVFASLFLGIMLGLTYLRFGLKGSIFFHVMYNLLWFIVQNNRSIYDKLFIWLDFGFLYWFVFLISAVLVVVFILRSIKFINSKYTHAESGI